MMLGEGNLDWLLQIQVTYDRLQVIILSIINFNVLIQNIVFAEIF